MDPDSGERLALLRELPHLAPDDASSISDNWEIMDPSELEPFPAPTAPCVSESSSEGIPDLVSNVSDHPSIPAPEINLEVDVSPTPQPQGDESSVFTSLVLLRPDGSAGIAVAGDLINTDSWVVSRGIDLAPSVWGCPSMSCRITVAGETSFSLHWPNSN